MPIAIAQLPGPFCELIMTQNDQGLYEFKAKKYRFKIVSPVKKPWSALWRIKIRVDYAKPKGTDRKWPSQLRLILDNPGNKPPDSRLDWQTDEGSFFPYQSGEQRNPNHLAHFYVFSADDQKGWISLLVYDLAKKPGG